MIIAALVGVDTAVGEGAVASALELGTETSVSFAFDLVGAVAAIRFAVTQQRRVDAMAVGALELAGHASESRAVGRLIRFVTAVILISNQ